MAATNRSMTRGAFYADVRSIKVESDSKSEPASFVIRTSYRLGITGQDPAPSRTVPAVQLRLH